MTDRNGIYKLGFATGSTLHSWYQNGGGLSGIEVRELIESIPSLPSRYFRWWKDLVQSDPVHVCLETILIGFVVYMIVMSRRQQRQKLIFDRREKLTTAEEEELLREWKESGRGPIAPAIDKTDSGNNQKAPVMLVKKVEGSKIYVDDDVELLNFANHDFLGMANDETVKDAARQTLLKYGCGSCGPRGFYGTIDSHLLLEEAISKAMNTDQAIMYSDGASAATSTVAAFAKRGDLLIVDEGIYEALGTGVTLSRANIKYFKHNDMEDLRRVLERVEATDLQLKRSSKDQRRFIVIEGLYKNHGTIAPLDQILKLKEQFHYRLLVDESFAFGTLGKTGKGATEMFGLKPMRDVEIITFSLENSLGSVGGVTIGSEEVVDHQRLSGLGYCFSASCPPFLATAAHTSLNKITSSEEGIKNLSALKSNVDYFHTNFQPPPSIKITSHKSSPIIVLQLRNIVDTKNEKKLSRQSQIEYFDEVARICKDDGGVALVSTGQHVLFHIHKVPPPAIRLTITALHTKQDIQKAINALNEAFQTVHFEKEEK